MKQHQVIILMGSDSDLPIMEKAAEVLRAFKIGYRMTVASAHRSPQWVHQIVTEGEKHGTLVFIAGAGGAAHLAGVVASITAKPVIGVPLKSALNGLDSLLSTVQMPRGVPVATVAVDNAANAAILAVEMIALADAGVAARLKDYRKTMTEELIAKARKLEDSQPEGAVS